MAVVFVEAAYRGQGVVDRRTRVTGCQRRLAGPRIDRTRPAGDQCASPALRIRRSTQPADQHSDLSLSRGLPDYTEKPQQPEPPQQPKGIAAAGRRARLGVRPARDSPGPAPPPTGGCAATSARQQIPTDERGYAGKHRRPDIHAWNTFSVPAWPEPWTRNVSTSPSTGTLSPAITCSASADGHPRGLGRRLRHHRQAHPTGAPKHAASEERP